MLKKFTKWTISADCIRDTPELCKKYETGGSQVKYDFVLLLNEKIFNTNCIFTKEVLIWIIAK